jgi:hypothetical protein
MRVSQLLSGIVVLLLSLGATGHCDEESATVEHFGDPANWHISGVETFDASAVKQSLSRDFEVVLAAHPRAPRSKLADVLRERLLEGYRSVGFADASADVQLDASTDGVRIHVHEGTRYRCGAVHVVGVDDEVADHLRRSLTTKQYPENAVAPVIDDTGVPIRWIDKEGAEVKPNKALWAAGKFAPFDVPKKASITRQLTRSLAELGYVAATFSHDIICDGTTAAMSIQVHDLGATAVLREIEIVGNKKNSRQDVIDYLALRLGERITNEEKHRIFLALRQSARFVRQQVATETIYKHGAIKLTITLQELPVAPRLSDPLSREDLALLKFHEWVTQGEGRHLDSVIQMKSERLSVNCVISPDSGVVATLRVRSAGDEEKLVELAFIASKEEATLYNLRDKRCVSLPVDDAKLGLTMGLNVGDNANKPFNVTFGALLTSLEEGEAKPAVEMKTTMEPAYFLALGRLQNAVCSWDDEVLNLRTDRGQLTIDSRSGRLLARSFTVDDYGSCTYDYREGAFQQAVERLKQETIGIRDEFDPNHPISSVLRHAPSLLELLGALNPDNERLQRAVEPHAISGIEKLIGQGWLHPADRLWLARNESKGDDKFSIPPTTPITLSTAGVGKVAAAWADTLFFRETWPAAAWREAALFLAGHREYTKKEVGRLANDDSLGPIGYWILAELFHKLASPSAAALAQRGIGRLDRKDFERDATVLAAKWGGGLGKQLRVIGSLSDDEVAALGRLVEDDPQKLVSAVQLLRQIGNYSEDANLQSALGKLWANGWQRRVGERLLEISTSQSPRVANERTKSVE